jgi:hypothetical protein
MFLFFQFYFYFLAQKDKNKQINKVFFHTPKLDLHIVLNVGKNTILRGEENWSAKRRPPPNLLVKTPVLKNIKTKTITNKTNTNNREI